MPIAQGLTAHGIIKIHTLSCSSAPRNDQDGNDGNSFGSDQGEEREREEDKTEIKAAVEEGIMAWKRARASSQITFPTTNDAGLERKCREVAMKMTVRTMELHSKTNSSPRKQPS
ncbi:unnamed protein product [Ectocarpus sp. 8 AP-2014]